MCEIITQYENSISYDVKNTAGKLPAVCGFIRILGDAMIIKYVRRSF